MDETDTNLLLDVTVVIQNRDGVSIYYYSQFKLNAVEGAATADNGLPGEGFESGAFSSLGYAIVPLFWGIAIGLSEFAGFL